MNTKFDYQHIRDTDDINWRNHWYNLLDGRWKVVDNELVEDANAPIFRLGFTAAEVAAAIQHTGYTRRELDWYQSQHDRYELIDGQYAERAGWRAEYEQTRLIMAIDDKLTEIDQAVRTAAAQPFAFNGHRYYPDVESIQGQFVGLPLLPADYNVTWKTADKDGLNNVYVTLDAAGIAGLAMALLAYRAALWSAGDALKKAVKELKDLNNIEVFKVDL